MKKHILASALTIGMLSFVGVAAAGGGGVEGTVEKIEGNTYIVKTSDGKEVKAMVDKKTAKKGDIKEGTMVVVTVDAKGHASKIEEHAAH